MIGIVKFAVGALATVALAMLAHSALGLGSAYIDRLESMAASTLGNAGGVGVTVTFVREPSLQRVAILSGDADPATRTRLLAAIRAIAGVNDARWSDDDAHARQED